MGSHPGVTSKAGWRRFAACRKQVLSQRQGLYCPVFIAVAQAHRNPIADDAATAYNAAPMAKQKKHPTGTIAQNKKARHDYFIEHKFEAGLVLSGWEVKSLRAGKAHLTDSYVLLKDGEAWLFGSHITPLTTASTHVIADPIRSRKLLLNKRELERVEAAVAQKGYTCVALALYWSKHLIKCEIALGKGKKEFDKRDTVRERDSNRELQRAVRNKGKEE
ncbi:SsrA-binding protein [compost metagenome]